MSNWPPNFWDVLLSLEGASNGFDIHQDSTLKAIVLEAKPGKGVAVYDPIFTQSLISEGLAEEKEYRLSDISGKYTVLTSIGKMMAELLLAQGGLSPP